MIQEAINHAKKVAEYKYEEGLYVTLNQKMIHQISALNAQKCMKILQSG